jgi:hypothetical protein
VVFNTIKAAMNRLPIPDPFVTELDVVTWVRGWFVKAVYLAESEDNLYSLAWYSSFYSLALCSSQYESFPAQDTSP